MKEKHEQALIKFTLEMPSIEVSLGFESLMKCSWAFTAKWHNVTETWLEFEYL